MNEEIIIDGVNVAECEYAGCCNGYCTDEYKKSECKDNPDCYFKQLKRLEKENERLKQGIKHYQRGMYKIISIATECKNNKQWNYKDK